MKEHPLSCSSEQMARLRQRWPWTFGAGLVYLLLGIASFTLPIASTVGITFVLAVLLVLGGLTLFLQAVKLRRFHGRSSRYLQAAITLIAGILIILFPGESTLGITLILGFYFLFRGIVQWMFAMSLRPHPGWGWELLVSVSALLLGSFILATFPASALWIPGMLLGIDLLVSGCAMIGFSLTARRCEHQSQPA